jgi:DNA-binding response OmpR family regulator
MDNIAHPKRARIALLESDDLIRALVERWLGEAGYAIERVTIDELKRGNGIELIIANVPSPRGAALLIRSLQAAHAAPLLLLSARFQRGGGSSLQVAEQLGVAAVLPKPFTRDELLTAVARAADAS